jgi:hypothetical protein
MSGCGKVEIEVINCMEVGEEGGLFEPQWRVQGGGAIIPALKYSCIRHY